MLQKDEEEKEGARAPTLSDTDSDKSGSTLPCLAVADWAKRSPTPERETAPSKAKPKIEGAEMAQQKKLPLPTEMFISFGCGKGGRKRGRSLTKRRTFEKVKGKVSRCELPDLSSSSEGEAKKASQGNEPASSSSASATQRESPLALALGKGLQAAFTCTASLASTAGASPDPKA